MKVLLDMDGVLVDFAGGACKRHGKPWPYTSKLEYSYDIAGLLNMKGSDFWDPLGFWFWANLEPLPWFEEVVKIVAEKFGKENVCLLSSPCLNTGCADGKISWISKHLPSWLHRRFLIGPAKQFCSGSGSLLIDDYDLNVMKFVDHGGAGILFPAPWNKGFEIDDKIEFLIAELEKFDA